MVEYQKQVHVFAVNGEIVMLSSEQLQLMGAVQRDGDDMLKELMFRALVEESGMARPNAEELFAWLVKKSEENKAAAK